ncbi:MAG: hypothetical protein LBU36_06580 [Clostridiales bacterium]|jgi:hypothetical protein|nr:hypothetical protein [Clostridiales bacterium]
MELADALFAVFLTTFLPFLYSACLAAVGISGLIIRRCRPSPLFWSACPLAQSVLQLPAA